MGRTACAPAAKESNSTRFSAARYSCMRPNDTSTAITAIVSSVVKGRGAKVRLPSRMGTIYCGSLRLDAPDCIQISHPRDARADLDQVVQSAVPFIQPPRG